MTSEELNERCELLDKLHQSRIQIYSMLKKKQSLTYLSLTATSSMPLSELRKMVAHSIERAEKMVYGL